ncbi:F-box/kelch-repeat protein [Dichanthelium oligosanthes]|uniref:F-box/kelch-repeat protein n=1 Tax=Dichanthelium oligosanthes TaxID=888268 RepID=A0A1E5UJ58_9POAL|nr:F-box/kelch-repeat protein [Dichanthelium oligosanthes]
MGDLIPGLPEEVARECLVRVGFDQLPVVRRISRQWKSEVESPDYHRLRRAEGLARPVLALALAQPAAPVADDAGLTQKHSSAEAGSTGGPANSYRMVLLDPVEGRWAPLPGLPGPAGSLPLFCQVAAVDGGGAQRGRKRLVVVGGWDPETWAPMDAVFVYDFLTGTWRRGAPMPGPRRSFFACAAVGGAVYVAGGHDEEKNALRSALAYDPEADAWAELPDMAEERDEPRGLCVGGRFLVVGGYPTQAQGRFVGSAEAFDPATSTWAPVQEGLLEDGACPRTCCAAPGTTDRVYMLRDGHLVARDGTAAPWRPVAQVPEDARTAASVAAIPDGRVVVIGSGCHGGDQTVYVLREEAGKGAASWARAPAPPEFSGHVQASCFLEI